MKRLCLLFLCVVLILCVGCTKQWSEEKGYIYRHDIELGEFAFLFDEWAYEPGKTDKEIGLDIYNAFRRDAIKPEDVFDALGLPGATTEDYGVISYSYTIGNEYDYMEIKYIPDKDEIDLDMDICSIEDKQGEENLLLLWSAGDRTIDRGKYKIPKRFDISEDELSFIGKSTTSKEVQQSFGAPHYYIELRETNVEGVRGNAFVYELENGNVLKIIYFRQGYIIRAWMEDSNENEIKIYVDRDVSSFYEDE